MRMELYKVEINRPNRLVTGYIVADDADRASEVLVEHEIALNQVPTSAPWLHEKLTMSATLGLSTRFARAVKPPALAKHSLRSSWANDSSSYQNMSLANAGSMSSNIWMRPPHLVCASTCCLAK